ncbi:hypothetical protein [Aeromicrobium sp. UC242_57]|uniref:hypothetical protein n=1 Tax=Aeromicrobium sp. UC242_57 TaxID=3374624 RepID=UPI0037B9E1D2
MLLIIIFTTLAVLGAAAFWTLRRRGLAAPRLDQLSREDQVALLRNQQGQDALRGSRDGWRVSVPAEASEAE